MFFLIDFGYSRSSPDFRYSLGLGAEERAYRKKRLPKVFEAMKKLLGDKGPQNVMEVCA